MNQADINTAAFLRLIRFAEHHKDSDDVYFMLYGGRQRFTDTSRHPNRAVTAWGHTSTAAGAYQILYSTWKEAKDKGVVIDFSRQSQDKLAIARIRDRHALTFVQQGEIANAIPLLRKEWTSLPGAMQSKMTMDEAQKLFAKYQSEAKKP